MFHLAHQVSNKKGNKGSRQTDFNQISVVRRRKTRVDVTVKVKSAHARTRSNKVKRSPSASAGDVFYSTSRLFSDLGSNASL